MTSEQGDDALAHEARARKPAIGTSGATALATVLAAASFACSSQASSTKDAGLLRDASVDGRHDGEAGRPFEREAGPGDARPSDGGMTDAALCVGGCPRGYACGTANGLPVCRAASGIPLFSHVFLIIEENTSLSTLEASITANAAPNFAMIQAHYASATNYNGVAHPSLPNYIAITSGNTQGIACDCAAAVGLGACNSDNCNILASDECSCSQAVTNLADQIEGAHKTWMAFGEGMGMPCNLAFEAGTYDGGMNYTARHVPFLYYDDIQTDMTRCNAHVVDFSGFDVSAPADFTYVAPNLVDDMHNPFPAGQMNITNGDRWIGPIVSQITASDAFKSGGLLVIAWDEDDDSGILGNAPIPLFVLSPYAKTGGYMSAATLDHYSLLATIEDGLNLPRLGNAAVARPETGETLSDFFPSR
jgi:hypothetical protein